MRLALSSASLPIFFDANSQALRCSNDRAPVNRVEKAGQLTAHVIVFATLLKDEVWQEQVPTGRKLSTFLCFLVDP
jgi:hypothetical protein